MTTSEQNLSPDEQVYQSNKSEPEVKKLYDNDPSETPVAAGDTQPEIAPGLTVDEVSAESFPGSDAPGFAPTAASTRVPESGDATLSE